MMLKIRKLIRELSWPIRFSFVLARYFSRRLNLWLTIGKSRHREEFNAGNLQITVINLDRRNDRLQQVSAGLEKVGFNEFVRFSAIEDPNGMLGCARSHSKILKSSHLGHDLLMVCEDDIEFACDRSELINRIQDFWNDPGLDVLSLSYTQSNGNLRIAPGLKLATSVRTTACYLVKPRAVEALQRVFVKSEKLLQGGLPNFLGAVDVIWDDSQWGELVFSVTDSPYVRQIASYSDIENEWVEYGQS